MSAAPDQKLPLVDRDALVRQLLNGLPAHVGGVLLAAEDMVRMMDRPGMTIEVLRETLTAKIFRHSVNDFEAWMQATLAVYGALPAERDGLMRRLREVLA